MNKKDINIDEQTECQDNMTDMNENVEEQAAEQATEATDTADADDNSDNSEKSGEYGEENNNEKSPLEEAQQQIDELKDKYLRSVAEFDNYRKRTLKEKAELILNGSEKAIAAVLPILDDMERAIANGEKTEDLNVLREGMSLIYTKFQKVLESIGVKEIEICLFPSKDLFRLEETVNFNFCGFGAVARMYDVLLKTHGEVATNGSRFGFTPVGYARQFADSLNGIHSFPAHGNDRCGHHRVLHALEERFRCEMGIMFAQNSIIELHHLHAAEMESFLLKSFGHFSNKTPLECTRFQQHKSFLYHNNKN